MFGFFRKNPVRREAAGLIRMPPSIAPEVRATAMDGGGMVFLHTGTGKLFTSNATGARIWQGLVEQAGLDSIAAGISSELGVPRRQAEEDAAEFVAMLEARGLISRERARA